MTIKTSTFSGWRLSGKDAEAFFFLEQIKNAKPNPLAQETLRRGEKLAREYLANGFVILRPTKKDADSENGQ